MNSEHEKGYQPRYPLQIINDIKKTKSKGICTFSVESLLYGKNPLPENPLQLTNVFSHYELILIQQEKAVTANLRPEDLTSLVKKSELVYELDLKNKYMFKSFQKFQNLMQATTFVKKGLNSIQEGLGKLHGHFRISNTNTQSTMPSNTPDIKAAFSCTIPFGKLKSKTPGDALLENPANEQELLRNRELAAQNSTNPKFAESNRKLVQAIDTAIHAYKNGVLKKNTDTESSSDDLDAIVLYGGVWKNKTGTSSEKFINNRKYHKCYRLNISYQPQMETFPIRVKIENGYMPIDIRQDRTQNILVSQELPNYHLEYDHFFSTDEWIHIIYTMQQNMAMFQQMVYPYMYDLAIKHESANRQKAQEKKLNNA